MMPVERMTRRDLKRMYRLYNVRWRWWWPTFYARRRLVRWLSGPITLRSAL